MIHNTGYLFNEFLAVEAGYVNLGQFTYKATSTTTTTNGSYKLQGANADVLAHLPLFFDGFSLTARGGLLYAHLKEEYSNTGSYTKNGLGFKYGLGAQYDFSPAWGLRGELENYHLEESFAGGADMQLFSIGVVYRFGVKEEVIPEPEPIVIIKEVQIPAESIVITTPPPPAERIVLASDALFDFDQAKLLQQGQAALKKLAQNITENDRLIITGHTDNVGTEEYNLKLSDKRANAVKDYLVLQGISSEQIETEAKGESEPVADNDTDEGRTANRRVEIIIITKTK
ncbi:MAG: OmpA family protein [Helicobacteraceae bacterium]|jgi:OOP family OmpA-OmpF porin|nr:OmpA family protein [Helicobacteraceae bacterium]